MSSQHPARSAQELEELWRTRLADAKSRYMATVDRFRNAAEHLRTQQMPPPDGGFAVHVAITAETHARQEYMRVLRVFTDLLLYGTVPQERDGPPPD